MKRLIVIQGPTASGKTALSIAVAQHFSTVIISADSRQFYKELSIGTAKPSLEEQQGIQHFFIDSHTITDEVSAARFAKEAESLLETLFLEHNEVVLTGGSGMFVDALCFGIDEIESDDEIRSELIKYVEKYGTEDLLAELKEKDPVFYEKVDKANPTRIIRAIQVIRSTGKPYSEQRTGKVKKNTFLIKRFIIEHPREQLYNRIDQRVDTMMREGLLDEVIALQSFRNLNALRTVGYKELFDFLDGTIILDKAIELIKQHTRNYAKRQLTWLRRYTDAKLIDYTSTEEMMKVILNELVE